MPTIITYAEMVQRAGSAASGLGQTVVEALIDAAENEANAYLAPSGLSISGVTCKEAVAKLTHVNITIRKRMDGSRPASLGIDVISIGNPTETEIENLREAAKVLLDQYIKAQAINDSTKRYYMKKVN